jgi:hypothetical protein
MVGVPGEEHFANADVGDGILLHGTAGGLSGAGSQQLILDLDNVGSNESGPLDGSDHSESRPLHGDSAGVPGASKPGDRFGSVLRPGPLGS